MQPVSEFGARTMRILRSGSQGKIGFRRYLEADFENYPLKISFNRQLLCSLQGIDRLHINNTVKFIFRVSYSEIIFHILKFLLILCDENY